MFDYRASLLSVVDGDSAWLLCDTGFYGRHQVEVRLAGVRAPERHEPGGQETREYVLAWMAELQPLKWPLFLATQKTTTAEPTEKQSFTRWVGDVWDAGADRWLNEDVRGFLAGHPEWGPGEAR